jgi:plastocyanin
MLRIDLLRGRWAQLAAIAAAAALLLAACTGASPSPTSATASEAASARCSVTPDVDPAATVTISGTSFGDEVTVSAGDAVAFSNEDSFGHTVTEGTNGTAASDACVDESVAAGATVVVTFDEPGDYQITCKIHSSMQTVIHVT